MKIHTEQPEDNYIPFGNEWVNEIKKFPKDMIIEMLKKSHLKRQELEEKISQLEISCQ